MQQPECHGKALLAGDRDVQFEQAQNEIEYVDFGGFRRPCRR
jgi:hypothetical protein